MDDLLSTVLDVLYDISYSTVNALQTHMVLTIELSSLCIISMMQDSPVSAAGALFESTPARR